MSRVANSPVTVPSGVEVKLDGRELSVKGAKGSLQMTIDSGVDVRIEDSKSGDDITRPVLLQIMAECEQGEKPMLSPALLMTLIRHYGHPMQDIVGSYLESSLVYYMRQEARLRKRMTGMFESIEQRTAEGAKVGREALASMRDNLMQVLRSNKQD